MNRARQFIAHVHSFPHPVRTLIAVLCMVAAIGMLIVGWSRIIPTRLGDLEEESHFATAAPPPSPEPEKVAMLRARPPTTFASSFASAPPAPSEPSIPPPPALTPVAGITDSLRGIGKFFIKNPNTEQPTVALPTTRQLGSWFASLGNHVESGVASAASSLGDLWGAVKEGTRN